MLVVCSMGHNNSSSQRQLFFPIYVQEFSVLKQCSPLEGQPPTDVHFSAISKPRWNLTASFYLILRNILRKAIFLTSLYKMWAGIWGRSWSSKPIINLTLVLKQLLAYFSCVNRTGMCTSPYCSII